MLEALEFGIYSLQLKFLRLPSDTFVGYFLYFVLF